MKKIKWFQILQIFLILIFLINPGLSKDIEIPSSIKFELSNTAYNKYLTRSMRAYTDGEIYGKKNIKKKI